MGNLQTNAINEFASYGIPLINLIKDDLIDRASDIEQLKLTTTTTDRIDLEQNLIIIENNILDNLSRANGIMLTVKDLINQIKKNNHKIKKAQDFVADYYDLRTKIPFETFILRSTPDLLAHIDRRTRGI